MRYEIQLLLACQSCYRVVAHPGQAQRLQGCVAVSLQDNAGQCLHQTCPCSGACIFLKEGIFAGTGKLHHIARQCSSAVVGVDWAIDMADARTQLGSSRVLQGNVDPMVLMGPQPEIKLAVDACLQGSGAEGTRGRHILNVGHGVAQGTPPDNVAYFCELARETGRPVADRREASALVA